MQIPHSFTLTMNLDEFDKLKAKLASLAANQSSATGTTFVSADSNQVTICEHDVDLVATYDGMAVLTIVVTAAHTLKAKLAPASMVESTITQLIQSNE